METLRHVYDGVREFHLRHKAPCDGLGKPFDVFPLRVHLITEELSELLHPASREDCADAWGDLLYVGVGTAVAYGFNRSMIWKAKIVDLIVTSSFVPSASHGEAMAEPTRVILDHLSKASIALHKSDDKTMEYHVTELIRNIVRTASILNFRDPAGIIAEIQRSNMTKKVSGDVRVKDKGATFEAPRLATFI